MEQLVKCKLNLFKFTSLNYAQTNMHHTPKGVYYIVLIDALSASDASTSVNFRKNIFKKL